MAYDDFEIPQISGWQPTYIGRGRVKYVFNEGANYKTMTGSAVTIQFTIAGAHIPRQIEVELTNSSNVPDTSGLTVVFKRHTFGGPFVTIASSNGSQAQDSFQANFDSSYSKNDSPYQLIITGANTDRAYPVLTVEYLGWEELVVNDTDLSIITQSPNGKITKVS